MKNINYYDNYAAYTGDTNRPTTESTVSSVGDGTGVIYTGKNILLDSVSAGVGDIMVFDKSIPGIKFIRYGTYYAAGLPDSITTIGVVWKKDNKYNYIVSKNEAAQSPWAQGYKVKLTGFDFTTGGDFTITVNSTTTANINYTTSDTLASVVTKVNSAINSGADNTALKHWTVATASNYITLEHNRHTPVITTVSITDASSKITLSTLTPIDYQTVLSGLQTAYSGCVRNDGGVSWAGANYEKFYQYYYSSGADTATNQAVGTGDPIRYSRYNSTDNPDVVTYYGTGETGYSNYIRAKMVRWPYSKTAQLSRDGNALTSSLASVTFIDADGSTKPAYPAAYNAKNITVGVVPGYTTGFEPGSWWLPSFVEFFQLIKDIPLAMNNKVNVSLAAIGGALINPTLYYWTSTEFSSTYSWGYYGSYGGLYGNFKYYSFRVRPFVAFSL